MVPSHCPSIECSQAGVNDTLTHAFHHHLLQRAATERPSNGIATRPVHVPRVLTILQEALDSVDLSHFESEDSAARLPRRRDIGNSLRHKRQ